MNIQTKYHGEMTINLTDIITFEQGIPGFPDENEFVFLPLPENDVFFIMQSVKSANLGFVVVNPFHFFKDYDFTLPDAVVSQLQLTSTNEVEVYVILTVQDPFTKTTANLQAPVIVNRNKQLGKQVILNDTNYRTKHLLFEAQLQGSKG
ncbi:MAG: flagellar assembly protein FliW [Bacillus sp. (in: Bacteria)]|nr:flagellar assembly protein FliW [Bacillus sp. (in: firmicutes)]